MAPRPLSAAALRRASPWLYLVLIAGLNVFICLDLFHAEYTGHTNAMHGPWIAMARLAGAEWLRPGWWPYWYAGQPFEHTYAPLLPALTSAYAHLAGCSPARAFLVLSGFFYCLGPVTWFLLAWRTTQAPGYAFAAALLYSLTSPTELIVPDRGSEISGLLGARRLYLAFAWDDVPHLAALALLPLAIWSLWRALQTRQPLHYLGAVLFMALVALANAFGWAMLAMMAIAVPCASGECGDALRDRLLRTLAIGAVAYLVVCPFVPPSLVETIRFNAAHNGEAPSPAQAFAALAVAVAGWLIVWRLARRIQDDALRFFALFAYLCGSIPVLAAYAHLRFLPQPGRYKTEMEIAMVLAAVFALRPLLEKRQLWFLPILVLLALALAIQQTASFRQFARKETRPVEITATLEYRVARWVEEQFHGQRVMLGGSLGQWANVFAGTPQLTGGAYTTAPNFIQQIAVYTIYSDQNAGERAAQYSITWLKAFGVQAVAVSGPGSREYWKPYAHPGKFEGVLPVLWREQDTAIYRVPQRSASLAHVIPAERAVRRRPVHGLDTGEVEAYVAALDDPAYPPAEMHWDGANRAVMETSAASGQVISVQVTYHPGWRARANGVARPVRSDGIGLMVVEPGCDGPCRVELTYDGGWEYRLCRAASLLTLAAAIGACASLAVRRRVFS